jgi:hypothetical protein
LDNIDVTFDLKISEEKITFSYGKEKKIVIDRSGETPFVRVYHKEEPCRGQPLIIITKKNKSHVYMELGFDRRLNYIDHYYDSNDRKVYALNILGFLLLISNSKIIGLEKLREAISNPNIVKVVPFLEYWKDFDVMGFNAIEELLSIGKVYDRCVDSYLIRHPSAMISTYP